MPAPCTGPLAGEIHMEDVYILSGLRSYMGVSGGIYKHVPAEILGAEVLRLLLGQYRGLKADQIIAGNAVGAGGNIARLMALEAGVDVSVPAFTVDAQCGSGLESVATAVAKIACGEAELILAGGFESSSTQPQRAYNKNHPAYRAGHSYSVAKFMPGVHRDSAMLEGAELTAERAGLTRQELDDWALRSHRLAAQAAAEGRLQGVAVSVCGSRADEGIRPTMNARLLARLPAAVQGGRYITAGNACLTNDGAAFVPVCSAGYAHRHGLTPQARVLGAASCGSDPLLSPRAAVAALQKLLTKQGLCEEEVDAFEVNEAFAVIDVLFARAFPHSLGKYNIFGGALAYGHPYGASGTMILLHLLAALRQRGGRIGCCSVAAAGGIGTALAVELV